MIEAPTIPDTMTLYTTLPNESVNEVTAKVCVLHKDYKRPFGNAYETTAQEGLTQLDLNLQSLENLLLGMARTIGRTRTEITDLYLSVYDWDAEEEYAGA